MATSCPHPCRAAGSSLESIKLPPVAAALVPRQSPAGLEPLGRQLHALGAPLQAPWAGTGCLQGCMCCMPGQHARVPGQGDRTGRSEIGRIDVVRNTLYAVRNREATSPAGAVVHLPGPGSRPLPAPWLLCRRLCCCPVPVGAQGSAALPPSSAWQLHSGQKLKAAGGGWPRLLPRCC